MLLSGCYYFYRAPEIIANKDTTKSLKLNGYYYGIRQNEKGTNAIEQESVRAHMIFLYENGCVLYGDYPYIYIGTDEEKISASLLATDQHIRNNYFNPEYIRSKKVGDSWGAFTINNDAIILKKISGRLGESLVVYSGSISNDTTFVISKYDVTGSIVYQENRVSNVNTTYHFRKFSPKPDSTNPFIIIGK